LQVALLRKKLGFSRFSGDRGKYFPLSKVGGVLA
jgi:hypothetical protein